MPSPNKPMKRLNMAVILAVPLLMANGQQARDQNIEQIAANEANEPASPETTDRSTNLSQIPTQSEVQPQEKPLIQRGYSDKLNAGVRQVNTEKPNVRGSDPLSKPGDGRPTAIVALKGVDRCENTAALTSDDICANTIESRSQDYARPSVTALSPEQRLLAQQDIRDSQYGDTEQTARRLGVDNNKTGLSLEDQGIAAIAIANSASQTAVDETPAAGALEDLPADATGIISSILGGLQLPPPQ